MLSLPSFEDDPFLEASNQIFWSSLIDHIKADRRERIASVLDVGSHDGGLLARLAGQFQPDILVGIEPSERSRERASLRLRRVASSVSILSPAAWDQVSSQSIDVLTCHEVLYLIEDLGALFGQISRVLRDRGTAYVVAGCHTENPLWPRWSDQLRADGHTVFDQTPFDILRAAVSARLSPALRPLRRDGWIFYSPDEAMFTYSSASELLDHQYRHKLLFRMVKKS